MSMPGTDLTAIENKVRRITARPSSSEITSAQIYDYVNTFYLYDFPEHLRLQNLRVNYQFLTNANQPVYDFPTELFLTNMPPVYIAGYQCYMTQSRENFFRISPEIQFMQKNIATGTGGPGIYTFQLTNTPIIPGWKRNPPGAYNSTVDVIAGDINWMVLISAVNTSGITISLVDDGIGGLWNVLDVVSGTPAIYAASVKGTINYITGAGTITNFGSPIDVGVPINCQYVPYVASRPMSVTFFQDQFALYPIPDQAYTVSFEAYKYPTALLATGQSPQLKEWWQCLALGASLKIFEDNADMENYSKYRPLLDEQLRLIQRRTIVQQTPDRVGTIYSEQLQGIGQFPFGNLFGS